MKIAVITPTISHRSYLLDQCKQSVCNQTTKVPVLHVWGEDVARVGCGQMRNKLIASLDSSYDWVSFLDDDDVLLPQHLDVLSQRCDSADIIYSDCETVGWQKSWEITSFNQQRLFERNYIPVTVLMRRSTFEAANGFARIFAEDWDLWKRCSLAGARFAFVPQVTWQYRRFGDSMLTTGQITF